MSETYIPNLQDIRDYTPMAPSRLPSSWKMIQSPLPASSHAFAHVSGLAVMSSLATMANGTRWMHISCSRKNKLPSWEDLKAIKRWFIGDDAPAVQVLPREADYVNIHPNCLHLWAPAEV